jgi:hypothetical protein
MSLMPDIPWTVPASLAAATFLVIAVTQALRPLIAATGGRHGGRGRSRWLTAVSGLIAGNPLLLVIAGIGFSLSFQTIAGEAARLGMPGWHPLYPIGIDVGILALVIEARRAIDDDRSDLVPRIGAWALSVLTIVINAQGASTWGLARLLHIIMPSLWVLFLELTRWRKLRRARAAKRAERIPLARWLADWPWRTLGMKRRMILSNVTSYPVACAREEARMLATDLARAVWGMRWKQSAPALFRHQIRGGVLPEDVARVASFADIGASPAMSEPVADWVAKVANENAAALARVAAEQERLEREQREREERQRARQDAPREDRQKERQRSRQQPRQNASTDRAKRNAKAKRLLLASPGAELADIAKQADVSERTVSRIKSELAKGAEVIQMAAR